MTRLFHNLSFSLLFAWLAWLNPAAVMATEYVAGDRIYRSTPSYDDASCLYAANSYGQIKTEAMISTPAAMNGLSGSASDDNPSSENNSNFWPDDLISDVTVLGDINEPGAIQIPLGYTLDQMLEQISSDAVEYSDSSYCVVRQGSRLNIDSDGAEQFVLQGEDIVIVARGDQLKPPVVHNPEPMLSTDDNDVTAGAEKTGADGEAAAADIPEEHPPLSPDDMYVLQAGDKIFVGLPDEKEFNQVFEIDREGVVQLPEIGSITLAGLSLTEAREKLFSELSKVFRGLDRLVVSLKERQILLTVLGFVESPGEVQLPVNGNIQMAINEAGGLSDGAQMDKLQLRRGDQVTSFDYKMYLDTGDLSILPQLQTLDVLFVPSSPMLSNIHGHSADTGATSTGMEEKGFKVLGEVSKPGSYPYKEGLTVVDLITVSGGVTRYANVEQIRVISGNEPVLFNLKQYLDSGDSSLLPTLVEDSTVFVPKQSDAIRSGTNVVYIIGQANKPGAYETSDNVNFLDVLANAGGPNRFAELRQVRILRSDGSVEPVDLSAYTEGKLDSLPQLRLGDAIFIPEKGGDGTEKSWLKLPSERAVKIIGAVKKPGRYEWSNEVDLLDLLGNAGGPTPKADLAHIKVLANEDGKQLVAFEFDLDTLMKEGGDPSLLPVIKPGYTITVPQLAESPTDNKGSWIRQHPDRSVYIIGDVVAPGRYAFSEEMDFLDILSAAEGPKPDADLRNIVINHRGGAAPHVTRFNMLLYFETGDETLLPQIQAGDNIYIPSRKGNWIEQKKKDTVRILGAVKTSGRYQFSREMSILDVLAEAGGPTKTAYIEKIIVVSMSGNQNEAYTFDLLEFMKDPDVSDLPVLRPGDTVYVPDNSNSRWAVVMENIKDILSIISLIALSKSL
ncbi:SLBB domain-containing protein [Endozoicomonadaceae bacterium StTr2]